jgi:hypothetical protein
MGQAYPAKQSPDRLRRFASLSRKRRFSLPLALVGLVKLPMSIRTSVGRVTLARYFGLAAA